MLLTIYVFISAQNGPDTKYILFWNEAYGSTKYGFCCGRKPFETCRVKDCYVTDYRDLLDIEKFDVIQFHQRAMLDNGEYDLPKKRSSHQRRLSMKVNKTNTSLNL